MQPKGLLKFLRLESFVQNIIEYAENRIAITKLEIKSKIGDAVRSMIVYMPIAILGLFALMFLSLTLAQALNVWLDSRVWGFLIVSVVYIILCGVLFSLRNSEALKKKIVDGSTSFLKEKSADEKKREKGEEAAVGYQENPAVEHKKFIFEEPESEPEVQQDGQPRAHTAKTEEEEEVIVIDKRAGAPIENRPAASAPAPSREPMPNPAGSTKSSASSSVRNDQQS
ncbi:phage holin family protein [Cesiribacter andamanensis]|uniref:Uncharacterized protein n=1 Tax=Cesiribacter andamanensis AMV16 TaxID=1279009 RepID=M7N9H9_9BACT|nr:phage holin family protein [Cesiribacter andamanensis]EMR03846.1 hypothetical protein ADICEAN_00995 [Cesiribacter andamanensis AMV16]